jgi:hypothetical protein
MTAIWLLSSRGRPKEAQDTIDACQEAGMTSRGVLYVDGKVDYQFELPKNWSKHYESQWLGLQGSMQWCLEQYPEATQYGWLADDTRPRTKRWDKKLELAAGKWNLAYARDLWMSEIPGMLEQLKVGRDLSSGLCWGGDLVRMVGWWALPEVVQAGIDTAWTEIVRPLQLHRYIGDVTVEHLNWRTGKRKYDETDNWVQDGVDYIHGDIVRRDQWVGSKDYRDTLRRVGLAMGDPDHVYKTKMYAMWESYANQLYMRDGGITGARLTRIMEGQVDIDQVDNFHTDQGSS